MERRLRHLATAICAPSAAPVAEAGRRRHRRTAAGTASPAPGCSRPAAAGGAPEDYTGKVVMVTGAGGGIGSAVARSFAAAGATLAMCDLRQDELSATEHASCGAGHLAALVDVSDEDAVS